MGTIYKRGQTYWLKYYHDGKPIYESSKSKLKMVAKELLKQREGEISLGKIPGVYFDKVTLDELAEDFLRDYRINNRKSITRAEISVKRLNKHFEGYRATQIITPEIKAYIEHRLNDKAANGTINRELSALKRILNLGVMQTPPKVDRVPHIPMLKESNIRKGFFEHGDFLALREVIPQHLKLFITFAYKTGWRHSEITGLTWSQVDLLNGIVRIETGETKNNEARTVYLDEELKEIFNAQWESRKKAKKLTPYVYLNAGGTDKVKRFDKAWQKACKKAKIGKRFFHDFRRTAVRNMVRAGIPEGVAMKISGHKTRSVFERYNIVSDTDLKLAAQKQEAFLKTQMVTKTITIHDLEKKANYRMQSKSQCQ
ncbi:MAG: site-specific integrase [Desulfobacteraceae bacterium]|nr:site-specific integrase [Desulfobacteraceae bacterium]